MADDRQIKNTYDEEEHDAPYGPPDDAKDTVDKTHPKTDSKIDSHELYDEGIDGAVEADTSKRGPNIETGDSEQ